MSPKKLQTGSSSPSGPVTPPPSLLHPRVGMRDNASEMVQVMAVKMATVVLLHTVSYLNGTEGANALSFPLIQAYNRE